MKNIFIVDFCLFLTKINFSNSKIGFKIILVSVLWKVLEYSFKFIKIHPDSEWEEVSGMNGKCTLCLLDGPLLLKVPQANYGRLLSSRYAVLGASV